MGDKQEPDLPEEGTGQIAARVLNGLFAANLHPIEHREYTHKEVERGIERIYKRKVIDASYISKLRNGHIQSPSVAAIEAICEFFDVNPLIFFPRRAARLGQETLRTGQDHRLLVAFRRLQSTPQLFQHFSDFVEDLADALDEEVDNEGSTER